LGLTLNGFGKESGRQALDTRLRTKTVRIDLP
jgi:hypothetical protein